MNGLERERLVDAWIAGEAAGLDSPVYQANCWAIETMSTLAFEDAEETWQIILEMLAHMPLDDLVFSVLAAGPLEDLLAQHGPAYIGRVEERAGSDADFNLLLGGVWKHAPMTDDVWARVQAVRRSVW